MFVWDRGPHILQYPHRIERSGATISSLKTWWSFPSHAHFIVVANKNLLLSRSLQANSHQMIAANMVSSEEKRY